MPLSISYWLDEYGEGEKLIQRFLQFLFPLRNQLLLPHPKNIGGPRFNPANSQWILDQKSLMQRGKQVVALLSGPAAAFKERRITVRCQFSLYLPSPDAIEVSAASALLVQSGMGDLLCPEPVGSTQNAIMREHGVD